MQDQIKNVSIYTDGGCLGNPGPGGYGVVLRHGEHEKCLSGGFRQTTNNRMEIMAVNVDLWELLLEACREHTVTFVWIRGHAGHQWNEICDVLSKEAAAGKGLPVDEEYERQFAAGTSPLARSDEARS
jgi:ribonuclease HI